MQLLDLLKSQDPSELEYVTVVLDEMYVCEGLVFQKSSGPLIGYSDWGEINDMLNDAERQYKNPDEHRKPLAKVFMIRGLFNKMKFVVLNFLQQALRVQSFSLLSELFYIA